MANQEKYVGSYRLNTSNIKNAKFIRRDPIARALSTKLIYDNVNQEIVGYLGQKSPPTTTLKQISDKTASNIEDSSNIFQTLPDVKLAMEIWTSYIISPKDFMTQSLVWKLDDYYDYHADMFNEMLDALRDYFENDYELTSILEPAIEDALFKTGSYTLIVIPESTIDDIINGKVAVSNESELSQYLEKDKDGRYYFQSKGFVGSPNLKTASINKIGLESYMTRKNYDTNPKNDNAIHAHLTITDNTDVVKIAKALKTVKKDRVKKRVRSIYNLEKYAVEDFSTEPLLAGTDNESRRTDDNLDLSKRNNRKDRIMDSSTLNKVAQTLYQARAYDGQEIVTLTTQRDASRLSVGHPLVMKIPSSAVIPVHVPGNPRDILGAFILLDEYGNPIDSVKHSDFFNESRNEGRMEARSQASSIIKQMSGYSKGCCGGFDADSDTNTFNDLAIAYASILESQLITSLSNGIYGEQVKINHSEEVMRVMLTRAIKKMNTQLFYCPSELLTYFAFDYNKYGIGKTLLDDMKMILALRSGLTYAEIFASIQNAIGRKRLNIELSEDEISPEKTVETIMSEYAQANSWNPILQDSNPMQIINSLRAHNVDVVISGSNNVIPETNVTLEDYKLDKPIPDTDFSDKMRAMVAGGLGLTPSILDETQNTQFAVQSINANILFNKRAYKYQKITNNNLLYDHVSKYTLNSGNLITRLSNIIKTYKDELTDEQKASGTTWNIIEDFIDALRVELPAPSGLAVKDQQEDFDAMKGFVDNIIEGCYPDPVLEMILPEEIEDKSGIRDLMKSLFMRQFVESNGYLQNFFELLETDNLDVDKVGAYVADYLTPFANGAVKAFFALDKVKKMADDKRLKDVVPEDGMDGGSDYDSGGSEDSGFDSGFDDEETIEEDNEDGEEGSTSGTDEFDF